MVIKKEFRDKARFEWERNVLEYLYDKLLVPRIIGVEENILYLEYIEGRLLRELSVHEIIMVYPSIINWMRILHSHGIVKGDANTRNFIITGRGVYGVDFEEARPLVNDEDVLRDIVDLLGTLSWIFWEAGEMELFLDLVRHTPIYYGCTSFSFYDILCELPRFYDERILFRPEYKEIFMGMKRYFEDLIAQTPVFYCYV